MRRVFVFIAVFLLLMLPVSAANSADSVYNQSTVASDGSCDITLTLQLKLDSVGSKIVFPLPADARDVTVNGAAASTTVSGSVRYADLSGVIAAPGQHTLTIRYRLNDVITADKEDSLILTLSLLCGFDYPIETFGFRITLPGEPENRPLFTSTYYQESVETMMSVSSQGAVIEGRLDQRLQDHETLTMTLEVSDDMFPQPVAKRWSMDTVDILMISMAALAVLYWLLTMRCLPPRHLRRTTVPDGITAGEVGCILTGQGVDFTLMVLSWAQMGYLLIQPDDNGRVLLHKRMEMGNERDDFEIRTFNKLFGKRNIVDGTGYHYARLCRRVSKHPNGLQEQFLSHSGNPKLFRGLFAAVGALSGISLAAAFADKTGWQIVLSILLAAAGAISSWLIQDIGRAIHSRKRLCVLLGAASAAVWLLLSFSVGEWNVALCVIPAQFLAGLAALYGGRRSETGKVNTGELLGLRHYLRTMSPEEVKRNQRIDPNYFYDLAPYALALGVDRAFARNLRKIRLPQCPYLTTGMDGHLTAQEWNQLLRDTVDALDAMQKRLPIDKLLGR